MKKTLQIFLFVLLATLINAQELKSVYILSEGGFSAGTSKLSKINYESGSFRQSIFNPDNIGLYPDGLMLHEGNVYLSEQGSWGGPGKIYKLDTAGTVLGSKEVANTPYSFAIANEKIYLTQRPFDSVAVLNLNDFSEVKNIKVGVFPESIISHDSLIFVANTIDMVKGRTDSTVSVINANLDSVIATITVGKNPSSLAILNDTLLIGCPGDSVKGMVYKVALPSLTKVDSFSIAKYGFAGDIFVDKRTNNIYFRSQQKNIVELNVKTKATKVVINDTNIVTLYGYAYDYINKEHYLTDAKGYQVEGTVTVYDSTGKSLRNYTAGKQPRTIVFEYDNLVSVKRDDIIAAEFKLEQNYPNPFNPTTTINYTVPSDIKSNIKLIVYDVLGNEIVTLVNKEQSSGSYQVRFNASELASGIYFYTLQSGNYIATKKMMLIK